MFKKLLMTGLCVLSGVLLFATPSSKTVEAEGFGETIEKAMKNARANAVRKAFGEVVDSIAEIKNDEIIESTISASSGFVLSAKIIGSPQYAPANKFYVVKMQVTVATEKMKDTISRFKKSSTNVNISAQLTASDKAEVQEKNAIKQFLMYYSESCKALKVDKFSYSFSSGTPILEFSLSANDELLESMFQQFKDVLINNGYYRIKQKHNEPWCYKGSVFAFTNNDMYENVHNEIYNNPDALLYYGPFSQKEHPQNIYFQIPKLNCEVTFVDKSGKRNVVIRSSEMQHPFFRSNASPTSSTDERCSFMGLIEKNRRFWRKQQSMSFRYSLQPPANMADVLFAEIAIVQKFNNFTDKRIVLNKFPVNGQDVVTQQTSLQDRYDSYVKIFVDIYRNIHKCLVPTAQFKYNRFKNVAEVEVKIEFAKRQYFNIVRKFQKQFDDLGIEKSFDWRAECFNLGYHSGRYNNYYNFPDPQYILTRKLGNEFNRYIYVLVLQFKDSLGDVLQETTLNLSQNKNRPAYYLIDSRYGILQVNLPQSTHMSATINFDIPEDIKNISTVECFIKERIKQ